jgi:exonuclease III
MKENSMVIFDWNCRGNFQKRYKYLPDEWDILVIQECADPDLEIVTKNDDDRKEWEQYKSWAKNYNYFWEGDRKKNKDKYGNYRGKYKGLGIFSKKNIKLTDLRVNGWSDLSSTQFVWESQACDLPPDSKLRYFLPVNVDDEFTLLGVWTQQCKPKEFEYIGQINQYLKNNKEKMDNIIILGDFNIDIKFYRDKITDKIKEREKSVGVDRFMLMLDTFKTKGIISLYHKNNDLLYGEEKYGTRYDPKENRFDYIDYCFVSEKFQYEDVRIADFKDWWEWTKENKMEKWKGKRWKGLSDHCPLILRIKNNVVRPHCT